MKRYATFFAIFLLFLFFFISLHTSLYSPIVFGDEGFHARLSQWIAEHQTIPSYIPFEGSEVQREGFYRPPFWNVLGASFLSIFKDHVVLKILPPLIALLTGIACFALLKRLFNPTIAFVASLITISLPAFLTYSVLYYTDVLFTLFLTLFFLLFLLGRKENSAKYSLLSAAFGALAILTKAPGIVVYAFIFTIALYELFRHKSLHRLSYLILPFFLLILLPLPFFFRNYSLFGHPTCYSIPMGFGSIEGCRIDQFNETLNFAGRVEPVGTEQSVYRMGLINYFEFAYGPSFFVLFSFICGLVFLAYKRGGVENYLLLSFIPFLVVFLISTTRAEDTARYTLGWSGMIATVSALWLNELCQWLSKHWKYLALPVFLLVVILCYQNASAKLSTMAWVKQFSPTFFKACEWVKQNVSEDSLLMTVWMHRAAYACQRNVIGNLADVSLSTNLNHTLSTLKRHNITHLFIQKFSIDRFNNHYAENYDLDWVQFLENNPQAFVKIYDDQGFCILRGLQGVIDQRIANNIKEALLLIRNGYHCDGNIIYEINYTLVKP